MAFSTTEGITVRETAKYFGSNTTQPASRFSTHISLSGIFTKNPSSFNAFNKYHISIVILLSCGTINIHIKHRSHFVTICILIV